MTYQLNLICAAVFLATNGSGCTEDCFYFRLRGETGNEQVDIYDGADVMSKNLNAPTDYSAMWKSINVNEQTVQIDFTNDWDGNNVEFKFQKNDVLGTFAYHGDTVFGEVLSGPADKWSEWKCDTAEEKGQCDDVRNGDWKWGGVYTIQFYTSFPTPNPTAAPTPLPTSSPTESPTSSPTENPTPSPTESPTPSPTESPTYSPTESPTASPIPAPTPVPSEPAPTVSTPEWVHVSDGASWDADTGVLKQVSGKDWEEGATGADLDVNFRRGLGMVYATWQGDADSHVMVGVSEGDSEDDENYDYKEIDCAMYMDKKKLKIYESGEKVFDDHLEYTADDVLGLSVDGYGVVQFYKNGDVFATCTHDYPLEDEAVPIHLDVSFKKTYTSVTFLGIERCELC